MERDKFELQLQRLVNNAEQQHQTVSQGNDKVWSNIQKTRNKNYSRYFTAASLVVICLSFIIWLNNEPPKAIKITRKTQNKTSISLADARHAKTLPIKDPAKTESRSRKLTDDTGSRVDFDKRTVKEEVNLINMPLKQEQPQTSLIVSTKVEIDNPPNLEPEVSVEFKRGKPIESLAERHIRESVELRRLRFAKETEVFISSSEKTNPTFKIKF